MPWAWVQGNAATSGGVSVSAEPCAYLANVTAGSLLIAVGCHNNADVTGLSTACTDSIGNTWLMAATVPGTGHTNTLYYTSNSTTGANTVTYTPPGGANTTFMNTLIHEYSGVNLTLDQVNTGTGTSGTAVTGPVFTNFGRELLFGFVTFPAGTLNIDATYTGRESLLAADTQTADKNGVSPGSYTFGGGTGVSNPWGAIIATFYESPSFSPGRMPLGA